MATFYWLGVTGASGNVNNVVNWTTWAPFGLCGFLPTHANRIPQYNEPIIFTKYSVLGACYGVDTYPIVAPQGPMLGFSGGNQYFSSVQVNPECPVPLGDRASYFRFRTDGLYLNVGAGTCGAPADSASYIDLVDASGITRPNASVVILAGKAHTYKIKGTARSVSTWPSVPFSTYATVYLENLELTTPSQTTISAYGRPTIRNYDVFHVYSTTTGYNGIYSDGSDTGIVVHRGYASGLDISIIQLVSHSLGGPTVTFEEDTGYEGATASDLSRTYVERLRCISGGGISNQHPNVVVKHGVDMNRLELYTGKVSFAQYPTADATSVQEGFMYAENTSLEILHPGTVSLGTNGSFDFISNGTSSYTPNISLKGNWTMDLTPAGVCGL
jgi:hypothetical protein